MLNVHILKTYLPGEDTFGVECVFKTLHIGFPTAILHVDTNTGFTHDQWIKSVCASYRDKPSAKVVFVDTDIIFYSEVESLLSPIITTLAGRYTPPYYNELVGCNEADRYHTSLLYISDTQRLFRYIDSVYQTPNFPFKPFAPIQVKHHNTRVFFDTCAILYHSIPKDDRQDFGANILDTYTHLVSGTMLNFVASKLKNGERLKYMHQVAKTRPLELKGLWREHDMYYFTHPPLQVS